MLPRRSRTLARASRGSISSNSRTKGPLVGFLDAEVSGFTVLAAEHSNYLAVDSSLPLLDHDGVARYNRVAVAFRAEAEI